MNLELSQQFSESEVWNALAEMNPSLALGPDGMSPAFFQKYWHVVGSSMKGAILQALNTVNGVPKGPIIPTRGLRQGDHLSPYLFLFCTEGLSSLLNAAGVRKDVSGLKNCRNAPNINHLLFTDDSVIFCKADVEENKREKTSTVFSNNVSHELQQEIRSLWGNGDIQQYEKYLGLPQIVGRSKTRAFQSIKQRVWQKLQSLKEKLLSQGGKEILLKVVTLSIPTYSKSCFLLPASFCAELEGLMSNFWWEQKREERRIHWVSWRKMCEAKCRGGFGFKNLRFFNLALLAKQGWCLLQNNNLVLHKLLKARYFSTSSFLESNLGHCPSFKWRSIWEAKHWLKEGCIWRIGDGQKVNLWHDKWLPGHQNLASEHGVVETHREDVVASVFQVDNLGWDIQKLRTLFNPSLVCEIMKIMVFSSGTADKLIWNFERNGMFSVKSCYRLIMDLSRLEISESSNIRSQQKLWKALWKMPVLFFPGRGFTACSFHLRSDAHKAGIGAILRDSIGHVLMAVSKIELALEDPETVELLVVFRGMQMCISMGISALEVESDCLLLVQALQQEDMTNSLPGNLFSEVKRLCDYFSSVSFVHVYREGNRAAHLLARNAWRVEDIDMWWDSIPDFLSQALWFDKCL
ncbi:uncharacterized protein LOC122312666 [Carya illinoinensis]|uniref:uncharacterized protein LOC122312666 n=1 Tax=Carya illinoinensis TaxID=32201 RepID=UPI001C71CE99|nr:uncharacterized protein LOC122312666 [Carya illinoinensis]